MCELRDYRRTEITILSAEREAMVGAKFIFDGDAKLMNDFGGMTPDWMAEAMRRIAAEGPAVSGSEIAELRSPEGGTAATALVSRRLDVTLGELLDLNARLFPDREGIVDATSGRRLTYRAMKKYGDLLARRLIDIGVKKGDTVAIMSPNSCDQLVTKFGILKTGAVIVNISPFEKAMNIERMLRGTDATVLFLSPGVKDGELMAAINEICPELASGGGGFASLPMLRRVIVYGEGKRHPGTATLREFTAETPKCGIRALAERMRSVGSGDVATIIHTSGTTGAPKGVMLTHNTAIENSAEHAKILRITGRDRIFMPVPMFHALGSIGSCFTALTAGATIVCASRPRPRETLELLRDERCTVMFSVPSHYLTLAETAEREGIGASELFLEKAVMAGDRCPAAIIEKTKRTLGAKHVIVMYGMTEAGPGISSTRLDDPMETLCATVGRPWPGVSVRIEAPEGADEKECGEICVKGYNVMEGYYRNRAATNGAVDPNGWLHTGDVGRIREDGNLVLCGRVKDIIIRCGENISPGEIEDFLCGSPDVESAVAVGAEDYRHGEEIYAYVRPREGRMPSAESLRAFCAGRLPSIKTPAKFVIVKDFPRSETGKLLRRTLRDLAQADHDAELKRERERQNEADNS